MKKRRILKTLLPLGTGRPTREGVRRSLEELKGKLTVYCTWGSFVADNPPPPRPQPTHPSVMITGKPSEHICMESNKAYIIMSHERQMKP